MFLVMKVFTFALIVLLGTVYIAPNFTKTGSEVDDIAKFKMEIPKRPASQGKNKPGLDTIKTLEDIRVGRTDISIDELKNLASQEPADLIRLLRTGQEKGGVDQSKLAIELAVKKAQEMIEDDGFFVKPGNTKPRE